MRKQTSRYFRAIWRAAVLMIGIAAVVLTTARGALAQEAARLFTVVPASVDLNERQALLLERISKRMTTKDPTAVRLIRVQDRPTADTKAALSLDVVPKAMTLEGYQFADTPQGKFLTWQGDRPQEAVSLAWSQEGDAAAGLVYTAGDVYEITPLGNGLEAMVPLDQSKFHEDHPPAFDAIARQAQPMPMPAPAPAKADAAPTEITILIAYTPKVEDNVGDIQATINGAVGVANTSYANSNVNLRLKLVHTIEVDYTESGTHEQDLERFRLGNDKHMDVIHTLRDKHKADLCVLYIDDPDYCGLAAAILANADTAFAVVHYDCAIGNLSFAHEVGHLQGARHNLEVDDTIDPTYPWNHGYLIPNTNGRTVMAYPAAGQPIRLPNWSNPDVKYQGVPTGTTNKQNNARMLNTSATHLSQFRP